MDPRDRRIREELEHHLEELQAQLEQEGMSAEEAASESRRRFGDPEAVRQASFVAGERRLQIAPRRLERGREAEEDTGEQ